MRKSFPHATNNIAELTALELALRLLSTHHLPNVTKERHIWTDSRYVRGAMVLGYARNSNLSILRNLDTLWADVLRSSPGLISIELHWTPAHEGVLWNEEADRLATSATQCQDVPNGSILTISEPWLRAYLHRDVTATLQLPERVRAQAKWEDAEPELARLGRQFSASLPPPSLPLFLLSPLSAQEILRPSQRHSIEALHQWLSDRLVDWGVMAQEHGRFLDGLRSPTLSLDQAVALVLRTINTVVWERALWTRWCLAPTLEK
jgi:ribonuclease HI